MALGGLAVPVPTLFAADGSLDRARNARFGRALCEAGVDHLFLLGSLGEFTVVEEVERRALVESVIESLTGRADAWVGCGDPSTARAVRYATAAEEAGAAAIVAVPPFYLRPTDAAVDDYYRALGAAIRIPLLAYNIPSKTGYALDPARVHALAREGVLAGIKDTSGSLASVTSFVSGAPAGFAVFPGDDPLAAASIAAGAAGAVMGTANIVPRLAVALVGAARAGDRGRADELQGLVTALAGVASAGPFPAADKYLAEKARGAEVGYRAPYVSLTEAERSRVDRAWEGLAPRLAPFLGGRA